MYLINFCILTGVSLLTAVDGWKDQTLFLCQISQAALRQSIFPVGGMMKHEVKQIAKDAGLERIANKKEVRRNMVQVTFMTLTLKW